MTARRPNREKPADTGKHALVLLGGGIGGALFEIGCAWGIEEWFSHRRFDCYIGTSAGAVVASLLAHGFTGRELARGVVDPASQWHLDRRDVFEVDVPSLLASAKRMLARLRRLAPYYARHPGRVSLVDLLKDLEPEMSSGLLSNAPLARYLARVIDRLGLPDRFPEGRPTLAVTAMDLDLASRVVLGRGAYAQVPLSRAVQASCAIPVLFQPVEVDGRLLVDGQLCPESEVELAVEDGARLIVVVNPMVPFVDAPGRLEGEGGFLGGEGVPRAGLSFIGLHGMRTLVHAKLTWSMRVLRQRYAGARMILIEPRPRDAMMVLFNPMSLDGREGLVQYGHDLALEVLRDGEKRDGGRGIPGGTRPRERRRKDPVCGMLVAEGQAPAKIESGALTYYFCSQACAERFEKAPSEYVGTRKGDRKGGMPAGV